MPAQITVACRAYFRGKERGIGFDPDNSKITKKSVDRFMGKIS